MNASTLRWHSYNYFPYERDLAAREVEKLFAQGNVSATDDGLWLPAEIDASSAQRLVYFSEYIAGGESTPTAQHLLEKGVRTSQKKQATRYSVHGLHEYKGKFNPQVAKAILNIFGVDAGDVVLDPFCGSGTTLVECAHLGASGVGFDLNPLAVYISNSKLRALRLKPGHLASVLDRIENSLAHFHTATTPTLDDERGRYLLEWFDPLVLAEIESAGEMICRAGGSESAVFMALASNLLREYSQQDPVDLRIRRRKSPLPTTPFRDAFLGRARDFVQRVEQAQLVLGERQTSNWARLGSAAGDEVLKQPVQADAAITSPPYAMALPYIDTQRLSLVWLGLVPPKGIGRLEGDLTGSREFRGGGRARALDRMLSNADGLPSDQHRLCLSLQNHLCDTDGFRRQAVPVLLYRYLAQMCDSFKAVKRHTKVGSPYALIVGHNHTTLGGVRHDIDTPRHLAVIAESVGWKVDELVDLQTYQRFGYHQANAVSAETLIMLRHA